MAHRVKELDELPHNLSSMPSINVVKNWYAESFEVCPCHPSTAVVLTPGSRRNWSTSRLQPYPLSSHRPSRNLQANSPFRALFRIRTRESCSETVAHSLRQTGTGTVPELHPLLRLLSNRLPPLAPIRAKSERLWNGGGNPSSFVLGIADRAGAGPQVLHGTRHPFILIPSATPRIQPTLHQDAGEHQAKARPHGHYGRTGGPRMEGLPRQISWSAVRDAEGDPGLAR